MQRDDEKSGQVEVEKVLSAAEDRSLKAKHVIFDSLKRLTCPTYENVWLGPFEQLIGGGYALLSSLQRGIYRRDLDNHYNSRVQAKVTLHIESFFLNTPVADPQGFEDWTSGFYFKAAIQRIVWAGERLLYTFAAVDCTCGTRTKERSLASETPKFNDILEGVLHRLDHVQNDDGTRLPMCRALREQFVFRDKDGKARGYRRDDVLDTTKVFSMLRYDVNNRKHRVYVRSLLLDQTSATKADNEKWHSSAPDFQFDLALQAFKLVCDACEELMVWNPNPVIH